MKQTIKNFINNYVIEYSKLENISTKWRNALVAYARADDPMFIKLKNAVSDTHAHPKDFMSDAKTVIAYFLPFSKEIVMSNEEGRLSSKEWALAYVETNKLIYELNLAVQQMLREYEYKSTLIPATHNFNEKDLISDWSHRHVAYVAGLGKFGLHNLLITEKGCCGRVGTIITNLDLEPTKRSDNEYCLYKHDNSCRMCIKKCVNEALGVDKFDRHKCYDMCLENADYYSKLGLADVCGKCISNVPCSFTNPVEQQ